MSVEGKSGLDMRTLHGLGDEELNGTLTLNWR